VCPSGDRSLEDKEQRALHRATPPIYKSTKLGWSSSGSGRGGVVRVLRVE
jgi:hypothetical protein